MGEIDTKYWLENMKGKDHSEDLDVDGKRVCIRLDLREIGSEDVD